MSEFDSYLFFLVNTRFSNGFFDLVMPIITELKYWIPVLFPLLLFLLFGQKGKHRAIALIMLINVGVTDQISSHIMKPLFQRKRPCCVEPASRNLIGCKDSQSFPSSHAANTAGVAGIAIFAKGLRTGFPLLLISVIVSFSRVYVGVHYPLDVVVGMLVGILSAWIVIHISRRYLEIPPQEKADECR